jgi:hypothetical protein
MRPGAAGEVARPDFSAERQLDAKFAKAPSAKNAAELLVAKRAARGR